MFLTRTLFIKKTFWSPGLLKNIYVTDSAITAVPVFPPCPPPLGPPVLSSTPPSPSVHVHGLSREIDWGYLVGKELVMNRMLPNR